MGKSPAATLAPVRSCAPAWLAEAGGALGSIVLPAGCRLCEQLLTGTSRLPVCEDCLASFSRIRGSLLPRVRVPIDAVSGDEDSGGELFEDVCVACRSEKLHFDADRLVEVVREHGMALEADAIIPVPLQKIRRRERGFNQAELLSKRLAKRLKLPHQGILLVRKRPRPDKHLLTSNERWEAVRGAFATRPGSQVDKQRVLLVDDVMTTGATLDACAKALREAGPVLCWADGCPSHPEPAEGQPVRSG